MRLRICRRMDVIQGTFKHGLQNLRYILITVATVFVMTTAATTSEAATRTWDGGSR